MPSTDHPIRLVPGLQPPTILFLIAWVLLSSAGPLLFAGDMIRTDLLDAGYLHRFVFTIQVGAVVFLLPLLLSSGGVLNNVPSHAGQGTDNGETGNGSFRTPEYVRALRYLLFTLAVVLLGWPFVFIAGSIADVSFVTLCLGQLQVAGLMLGTGGIWWGAGQDNTNWVRYLFIILLCLSLVFPVIYVGFVQILDVEHPWLLLLSPITAAAHEGVVREWNPRIFQTGMCIFAGFLVGGILYFSRASRGDQ